MVPDCLDLRQVDKWQVTSELRGFARHLNWSGVGGKTQLIGIKYFLHMILEYVDYFFQPFAMRLSL